jgi:putative phosphoribosyl transferase
MFKNRQEAGKSLALKVAERVHRYKTPHPVRTIVVGLARGGVIVAKEVATLLCAPLTLVAAKQINSPNEPDLAIAAVSSSGLLITGDMYDDSIEGLPSYVRNQQMYLAKLSKTLETHWLDEAKFQPPTLGGKRVVLVSDYCTSGLLELAVMRGLKSERPNQLILATPVIGLPVRYRLDAECNEIVALKEPDTTMCGAMQYYESLPHVEDAEIVAALQAANRIGTSTLTWQ